MRANRVLTDLGNAQGRTLAIALDAAGTATPLAAPKRNLAVSSHGTGFCVPLATGTKATATDQHKSPAIEQTMCQSCMGKQFWVRVEVRRPFWYEYIAMYGEQSPALVKQSDREAGIW